MNIIRPHTVTIRTSGKKVVEGELISNKPIELTLKEVRFDDSSYKVNKGNGLSETACGELFTSTKSIEDAEVLIFQGKEFKILDWVDYTNHSIIYVQ